MKIHFSGGIRKTVEGIYFTGMRWVRRVRMIDRRVDCRLKYYHNKKFNLSIPFTVAWDGGCSHIDLSRPSGGIEEEDVI